MRCRNLWMVIRINGYPWLRPQRRVRKRASWVEQLGRLAGHKNFRVALGSRVCLDWCLGLLPANRAAHLNPAEALRSE